MRDKYSENYVFFQFSHRTTIVGPQNLKLHMTRLLSLFRLYDLVCLTDSYGRINSVTSHVHTHQMNSTVLSVDSSYAVCFHSLISYATIVCLIQLRVCESVCVVSLVMPLPQPPQCWAVPCCVNRWLHDARNIILWVMKDTNALLNYVYFKFEYNSRLICNTISWLIYTKSNYPFSYKNLIIISIVKSLLRGPIVKCRTIVFGRS